MERADLFDQHVAVAEVLQHFVEKGVGSHLDHHRPRRLAMADSFPETVGAHLDVSKVVLDLRRHHALIAIRTMMTLEAQVERFLGLVETRITGGQRTDEVEAPLLEATIAELAGETRGATRVARGPLEVVRNVVGNTGTVGGEKTVADLSRSVVAQGACAARGP